jgi:endonuclease/exonuclease/phosphatase family metal-dependent hydrolase
MKRVFSLLLILLLTGCTTQDLGTMDVQTNNQVIESNSQESLVIGTWNVQIFGKNKISNETIKQNIEDIISQYDLLAFQEIRDVTETAFPNMMNDLPKYDYLLSPRLGRSNIKEQYAFIYNPEKLKVLNYETWYDANDVFEREPFIAEFQRGNITFVVIQIHTKPDDATNEIKALKLVKENVEQKYNVSDIFLVGDFNSDGNYYQGDILSDTGMVFDMYDGKDTTVHDTFYTYDRILFMNHALSHRYSYGVFEITDLEISDHKPLWLNVN